MIGFSNNKIHLVSSSEPVGLIADCLVRKFANPLFSFCTVKTYRNYVNCIKEILKWSAEFYAMYYTDKKDYKISETIKNNIYNNGIHREEFLIAWGDKRMKQFFAQRVIETKQKTEI